MKKRICAGNWKMNGDLETIQVLSEALNKEQLLNTKVIIAVPYTLLREAKKSFNTEYKISAQSISAYSQSGAYTGDISAKMVKDADAEVVIIGHSERAKYFQETNEQVKSQLKYALESSLEIILCMGETEEERQENKTLKVIRKRLEILKEVISSSVFGSQSIIVAYEPIWAIGTGKVPNNQEIEKVTDEIAREMKGSIEGVLYGGSVNKNNARSLLGIKSVSGFLVGNASITPDFVEICKECNGNNKKQAKFN